MRTECRTCKYMEDRESPIKWCERHTIPIFAGESCDDHRDD